MTGNGTDKPKEGPITRDLMELVERYGETGDESVEASAKRVAAYYAGRGIDVNDVIAACMSYLALDGPIAATVSGDTIIPIQRVIALAARMYELGLNHGHGRGSEEMAERVIAALRDGHANDSASDQVEFVSMVVGWSAEDDEQLTPLPPCAMCGGKWDDVQHQAGVLGEYVNGMTGHAYNRPGER